MLPFGGLYLSSSSGKNNSGHNHSIQLVCCIRLDDIFIKDTVNAAFHCGINLEMVGVFSLCFFLFLGFCFFFFFFEDNPISLTIVLTYVTCY